MPAPTCSAAKDAVVVQPFPTNALLKTRESRSARCQNGCQSWAAGGMVRHHEIVSESPEKKAIIRSQRSRHCGHTSVGSMYIFSFQSSFTKLPTHSDGTRKTRGFQVGSALAGLVS